eukprot:scaffold43591_cov45-Prasinocladus_malaysianus.AAC.1
MAMLFERKRHLILIICSVFCHFQEALPADYAFVLHTANPVTGAKGEVVGEIVKGLGEVLVSNTSGSALFFVAPPNAAPNVISLPSKMASMSVPGAGCLIARSDSNGEDLEVRKAFRPGHTLGITALLVALFRYHHTVSDCIDFAGAGLYDSILTQPASESPVNYAEEPLLWDSGFQQQLMSRLVELGKSMEATMGSPQDVEGLVINGDIYVVQSRPQILNKDK